MLSLLLAGACALRPPPLVASGDPFAGLIEDAIAASHRDEGGQTEEWDWQDRLVRWRASAIPLRMVRNLSTSRLTPGRLEVLIELQLDTVDRILKDDPEAKRLQPSLNRLRNFLREGRHGDHVEAAVWDVQRVHRRAYSEVRLLHRRWKMRQAFEAGHPWEEPWEDR